MIDMPATRRPPWVALGPSIVALALGAVAFGPALGPERQVGGRDAFLLYYPMFRKVAEAQRALELPARDPTRGCGAPLWADPLSQVAYPPSLVRAVLPFDLGFALWYVLHAGLAGAGAAALARRLGASSRGACLAAAGAALSGPLLSNSRCPNLLAGAAWVGFALAAFVDLLEGRRLARAAALGAAAIGLMLLAGGVEVVMTLGVGLGALLIHRLVTGAGARVTLLGALRVAGATALGAALAAPHLLPVKLWLAETPRRDAIPFADASQWSEHPLRLVEAVVPWFAPATVPEWSRLISGSWGRLGAPLHDGVHVGLVVVLLAGLAIARAVAPRPKEGSLAGDRWLGPLSTAGAAWLLIAFGRHAGDETSPFALLRHLPLFDQWRYPGKAVLPLCVLLPALAGVGLTRLAPRWRCAAFGAALVTLILGARQPGVVFTVPQAWYHEPPAVAKQVLAAEADRPAGTPPGRYMRLVAPAAPSGTDPWTVRGLHRDLLLEDLPGLYGLHDWTAYGPFVNRRLGPWLQTVAAVTSHGPRFDLPRIADDAGVGHLLMPAVPPGVDPALAVPVEGPGRVVHQTAPPRVRLIAGSGGLVVLRHEATTIELRARLDTPGRVYVSEAFDPGWRATRDGAPLPLVEARIAFMAFDLPAGASDVRLEFHVPGLRLGLAIGFAALGVLALLLRAARR